MPIFQTNTGYRDPLKAMTIKALEERQAAAAAAAVKAQQVPEAMVDPLQAVGHAFNVMGQGLQQSRIDNAAASQRDALAKLRAGINMDTGATSEQLAQIGAIDPNVADQLYEAAMQARRDAAQREHATRERIGGQEFEAGQNTLTRQQAITLQDDAQLHDVTTATTQYGRDQEKAKVLAETQRRQDILTEQLKDPVLAVETLQKEGAYATPEDYQTALATAQKEKTATTLKTEMDAAQSQRAAAEPYTDQGKVKSDVEAGVITPEEGKAAIDKLNYKDPYAGIGPLREQLEVEHGKTLADWQTNRDTAMKSISEVDTAINTLSKWQTDAKGQLMPPSGLAAGAAEAVLPEFANRFVNPVGTNARDSIHSAVQNTMKATLGSQFAMTEGEQLLKRAFAMGTSIPENIRRAKMIMAEIKNIAAAKDAMQAYALKKGNMIGYAGPTGGTAALSTLDFGNDTAPDTSLTPAGNAAVSGTGGGGDEEYKEGDIVSNGTEKMILKNGQWVPYNG